MNELNKLIEQYETENPDKPKAIQWMNPLISFYADAFVEWQADQIKKLAFRPTCGKEQRKFLDEVEKSFESIGSSDKTIQHKFGESLIDGYDFEDICDLQKVIKGE